MEVLESRQTPTIKFDRIKGRASVPVEPRTEWCVRSGGCRRLCVHISLNGLHAAHLIGGIESGPELVQDGWEDLQLTRLAI